MPDDTPVTGNQTTEPVEKPEPFLGTYKSKEEAEKGLHEKDKTIAQLAERMKKLESEANSTKAIETFAAQMAASTAPKGESKEDLAERRKQLAEEIAENPGKAVDYMSQLAEELEAASEKKIAELQETWKQQLDERLSSVASKSDVDPDFVARRDEVLEIEKEFGLSRDKALALAKRLKPEVEPIAREIIPGGGGNGRHVTDSKPEGLSKADRAEMKRFGASDEELDNLDKQYRSKAKAMA